MKILALDIGDKWVGSAISDPLGITCKPYITTTADKLDEFLDETTKKENIATIVIGHPKTLKSGEGIQAKKVVETKKQLEKKYPEITWVLWDERLSSKRAQSVQGKQYHTKEGKLQEHSIAAAFILQSYLDYVAFKNS